MAETQCREVQNQLEIRSQWEPLHDYWFPVSLLVGKGINLCLSNFSEALLHSLQLSGSLESWYCPQTSLQILLAVLCTALPITKTLFQMWSCKWACRVGSLRWSETHLHRVSALALMLAAAGCKFNSWMFFPSRKKLIHKKIVPKFTASQEKNAIH